MTFELALAFTLGLLLGGAIVYWIANRLYKTMRREIVNTEDLQRLQSNKDLTAYMEVLRREVGAWLMLRDPDALLEAYDEIRIYENEVRNGLASFRDDEAKKLSEKYPFYSDFDILGTRHFIPYTVGFELYTDKELLDQYKDISKFVCLMANADSNAETTSSHEREILIEKIRDVKNQWLREKVICAMGRYFRRSDSDDEPPFEFEDEDFRVRILPATTPAADYGVTVKESGDFAVFELFTDDDGKTFESVFRSDKLFEGREHTT